MQWIQDTFNSLVSVESGDTVAKDTKEEVATATSSGKGLQTEGQLSRDQLLQFFDAGSKALDSEELRRKLKDAKLLKQDLEDLITETQKQLFESQGVAGSFGVAFLGSVNKVYKADDQVMAAFLRFVELEEDALDEAELSEAEYEQKQRVRELAKAHTAQLMQKLQELPAEDRQAFLADQMRVLDQIKQNQVPSGGAPAVGSSMSTKEQEDFFKSRTS